MNYPKITIITPSFNQGMYIEECILSILAQNYPNLEYFIIDGASKDNTVEIIKKYESKIDFWVSEPDNGQSDAINKGLQRATGDIINWLNADDIYEPDALWKIAQFFENPQIKVVCGKCKVLKINTKEVAYYANGTDIYPTNLAKTIGWARTDQPATFYRASAIAQMGELDVDLHYLMDRDWWIKYLLYYGLEGVIKIPDILVSFRLHSESKTITSPNQFHIDRSTYFWALAKKYQLFDYQLVIEKNEFINSHYTLKNLPASSVDLMRQALNYYFLWVSDEYYAQSQFAKAKQYIKKVKIKLLRQQDKFLARKLYFCIKFLPNWLINRIRGFRKG